MNRNINIRCSQLIKEYAEYPEATESLKQRIMIAANRARNKQRRQRRSAPLLCSLMVMIIVVASNVNQTKIITSGVTGVQQINQTEENSVLVSLNPITKWDTFNNENEFVDMFIRHRSWQTSLFRKPITRL